MSGRHLEGELDLMALAGRGGDEFSPALWHELGRVRIEHRRAWGG